MVAAVLAIGATLIFRVDPVQVVVTLGAGLIALGFGTVILVRPTSTTIRASSFVGAAWFVLYLALAVVQSGEIAAWTTDIFVGVVGVAAALVAFRATGRMRPTAEPR